MIAIAALFGLLAIRSASPHFPWLSSVHLSTRNVVLNQGHRPHFDSERIQWSAPARVFFFYAPAAVATKLSAFLEPSSKLQTKGFRYNRPPPVC
jgi:hypothetical protein